MPNKPFYLYVIDPYSHGEADEPVFKDGIPVSGVFDVDVFASTDFLPLGSYFENRLSSGYVGGLRNLRLSPDESNLTTESELRGYFNPPMLQPTDRPKIIIISLGQAPGSYRIDDVGDLTDYFGDGVLTCRLSRRYVQLPSDDGDSFYNFNLGTPFRC